MVSQRVKKRTHKINMIYYLQKHIKIHSVIALCITVNIRGWMLRPYPLSDVMRGKLGGLQSLQSHVSSQFEKLAFTPPHITLIISANQ